MNMDALVSLLARIPMLRELESRQLRELARHAERLVYRPGDFLIEEGRLGDAAILIVTGQTLRVSGPELPARAEIVPPGSLLSEMAMLIEIEHMSTVIARSPVRAMRLLRSEVLQQMERDASLGQHFIEEISGRLHDVAARLREIDTALAGPSPESGQPPRLALMAQGPRRTAALH